GSEWRLRRGGGGVEEMMVVVVVAVVLVSADEVEVVADCSDGEGGRESDGGVAVVG
ncbi:hypothetical protein Tco_1277015, partial [Tanacetum coccineum]